MEQIVFPIPEICEYITSDTKVKILNTAERDDQGSKVSDFFERTEDMFNEMKWQKKLRGKILSFRKEIYNDTLLQLVSLCLNSEFYGTRRLSLIQSIPPPSHFLNIHLNTVLPSMPESPKQSLSLRFPYQNPIHTYHFPHTCYMPRPSHSSQVYHPNSVS